MNSAFSLVCAAASSRASVFPDLNRRGAGHAAQRWVALIVERVVGNIMLHDVFPNIFRRPTRERVDLNQTKLRISLDDPCSRARRRLIAPDPRYPGTQS